MSDLPALIQNSTPEGPEKILIKTSSLRDGGATYAILEGKEVKIVDDCLVWAKWKEENRAAWIIKQETLDGEKPKWINPLRASEEEKESAKAHVSTVFLGLNHSFGGGAPLWFETMIFNGPLNNHEMRATTYEQALENHEIMLRKARAASVGVLDGEEKP